LRPAVISPARSRAPAALVFALLLSVIGISCGISKPAGLLGGAGGSTGAMKACLDRPADLPRPPSATLPCELLPPDFSR